MLLDEELELDELELLDELLEELLALELLLDDEEVDVLPPQPTIISRIEVKNRKRAMIAPNRLRRFYRHFYVLFHTGTNEGYPKSFSPQVTDLSQRIVKCMVASENPVTLHP